MPENLYDNVSDEARHDWLNERELERDEYDQHLEAVYEDELDRLRDHGE